MTWKDSGTDSSTCVLPIALEDDARTRAALRMTVKRSVPRNWKFKLELGGEEVRSWHFTGHTGKHSNPPACGPAFKPTLRGRHQEHCWSPYVERCKCARELPRRLDGLDDHEQALRAFCEQFNIRVEPRYLPPATGEQGLLIP